MTLRTILKDVVSPIVAQGYRSLVGNHANVLIMGYHSISPDHTVVDVEPSSFVWQIEYLRRYFSFVSLDDIVNFSRGKKQLDRASVAITFDDGYRDLMDVAVPALQSRGIPATVFVLSRPERANREELDNNKSLLSRQQVLFLRRAGWTIGCHSATHQSLISCSTRDLRKEVITAKQELERVIGEPVRYFSYPKGRVNGRVASVVKEAGFEGAVTTTHGVVSPATVVCHLPRVMVDGSVSQHQFPVLVTPVATWYFKTKQGFINRRS